MTHIREKLALQSARLLCGSFIRNKLSFLSLLGFDIPLSGLELRDIHYKSNHTLDSLVHQVPITVLPKNWLKPCAIPTSVCALLVDLEENKTKTILKLTHLMLLNILNRHPRKHRFQRLQKGRHLPFRQLRVETIKHVIHVLPDIPLGHVIIAVGVPDQGTLQHGDGPVEVNCKHCHSRVGNDAQKLLSGPLGFELGLDALVDIGASALG